MRKSVLASVAIALSSGFAVSALAASGVVVSKSVDIKGKTPQQVLEKFGSFCAIGQWHPALAKCEES